MDDEAEAQHLIDTERWLARFHWAEGNYLSWWFSSSILLGFRVGARIRFGRWL